MSLDFIILRGQSVSGQVVQAKNVRPRQKFSKLKQLMTWVYKTSVSHFNVKNTCTPLKHTDRKRKFKRMLSFLLVENGRLFFTKSSFEKFEIHEIFITADQSALPVLKRNQAAKFLKNFQVHLVLYRSFSLSRNKK